MNISLGKPEFTKIPNVEYKVILGDEVRMECAAEGHPSPRIEWLREGYDRVLSYEETLVVNSADFSSAGVYICRAVVNNMYLAESRARVTVFGVFKRRKILNSAIRKSSYWSIFRSKKIEYKTVLFQILK